MKSSAVSGASRWWMVLAGLSALLLVADFVVMLVVLALLGERSMMECHPHPVRGDLLLCRRSNSGDEASRNTVTNHHAVRYPSLHHLLKAKDTHTDRHNMAKAIYMFQDLFSDYSGAPLRG